MSTNLYYNNKSESPQAFFWLMVVLLVGTNFLGLMPFAGFVNSNTKPVILLKCIVFLFFAIKTYDPKNKVDKWLLYLWIAFALNKISSVFFRAQPISEVPFQGSFIYDFGFYYIIRYIRPSISQIEKSIVYLGIAAIALYFIQYILLPTPIVESLSEGWRSGDKVQSFDIYRFAITGEVVICLFGLFSLNQFLIRRRTKYLIVLLATLAFILLHGYRTIIIAYILACLFLYVGVNGLNFNLTTISTLLLLVCCGLLVSNLTLFDDILGVIHDKNESQSLLSFQEIDRVIEFNYFYDNIKKPFEWLFGAGFVGKNFSDTSSFINWVDLGFIGLSFMGGIILTFCWIKLLFISMDIAKYSRRWEYVRAFMIFIIISTITLPTAFNNKANLVQVLVLYLFTCVSSYVKRLNYEK